MIPPPPGLASGQTTPAAIADHLIAVLAIGADDQYGDEAMTQLSHALHAADLARAAGLDDALIAAALLHDIGHLVDRRAPGASEAGIDRRHEQIGAQYLARWFRADVVEPIRLHVAAKRYLCAADPTYLATLSPASRHTLTLQGGVFSAVEAEEFIAQAYAADAVRLRRFDEAAKEQDYRSIPLEAYLDLLAGLIVV